MLHKQTKKNMKNLRKKYSFTDIEGAEEIMIKKRGFLKPLESFINFIFGLIPSLFIWKTSAKLRYLRAHVPACLECLHAYVSTCLACSSAHKHWVPMCSRAITANDKYKFSIICFPYIFVIVLCLFPVK